MIDVCLSSSLTFTISQLVFILTYLKRNLYSLANNVTAIFNFYYVTSVYRHRKCKKNYGGHHVYVQFKLQLYVNY